jgi:hypothetical protein
VQKVFNEKLGTGLWREDSEIRAWLGDWEHGTGGHFEVDLSLVWSPRSTLTRSCEPDESQQPG